MSGATVSKEDLLKRRFGVEPVEIPGVGTVEVRPLSRAEVLAVQGADLSAAETERRFLSKAMVSPSLTEDEVATWQENSSAGSFDVVTDAIERLSGLKKNSAAEAMKSVPD